MAHQFVTNLNGDTPETVVKEFVAIAQAARAAKDAIAVLTVHGRNYQFEGGAEALQADLALKAEMRKRAQEIFEWAEAGVERAADQGG